MIYKGAIRAFHGLATLYNLTRHLFAGCALYVCVLLFFASQLCAADKVRVYDEASLLNDEQRAALQLRLEQASAEFHTDLFVLTSPDIGDMTPKQYAENFFWGSSHGTEGESGVVLVINMIGRDVWIATFGRAIHTFAREISAMIDALTPPLAAGEYAVAFDKFADFMRTPLLERPDYFQRVLLTFRDWPHYVIAAIVAFIVTLLLSFNARGKRLVTNKTYEVPDSFKLTEAQDRYLRTTRTRTKVSDSSSSSSSSSSRSSGGGGKF